MMRKLIGKCALALALPSAAAALLVGGTAPAALAATPKPVIQFDGAPGTSAPPATLGPYTMTKATPDSRTIGDDVSDVTLPDGTMTFSPDVQHVRIGDPWATWSNGYTGDVYFDDENNTLTMTLPAGTGAFYFYLEPDSTNSVTVQAVAQNGTTSGSVSFSGHSDAKYFGFYGTGGATIKTIEVTTVSGASEFAVGEFGVGTAATQLALLRQAVRGVKAAETLSTIVALAQQQLSAGHTQLVCLAMATVIIEVREQQVFRVIPAAVAEELIADATNIETILGCSLP